MEQEELLSSYTYTKLSDSPRNKNVTKENQINFQCGRSFWELEKPQKTRVPQGVTRPGWVGTACSAAGKGTARQPRSGRVAEGSLSRVTRGLPPRKSIEGLKTYSGGRRDIPVEDGAAWDWMPTLSVLLAFFFLQVPVMT